MIAKLKLVHFGRYGNEKKSLKIKDHEFEHTDSFQLGVVVNSQTYEHEEVRARINTANRSLYMPKVKC